MEPRQVQSEVLLNREWGFEKDRTLALGPNPEADAPSEGRPIENGDPRWDAGRFGNPAMLDVYNVLLLEKKRDGDGEQAPWWWERVGVGKVNVFAFGHAKPEDKVIKLG